MLPPVYHLLVEKYLVSINITAANYPLESGPYGGTGGLPWSDAGDIAANGNITQIEVRTGGGNEWVDQIRVGMGQSGDPLMAQRPAMSTSWIWPKARGYSQSSVRAYLIVGLPKSRKTASSI